ncbi:Hint domain-containing protein [Poseidonocella pacifica]|uniref:Hint domain-containing protein n=1 Tax=Poseidonocella pacifica TaxID=871651 RepID=A0A1I0X8I5_9RHOB|nr:Hint domain-containing protein [Poseidonocella pacifica]SFA97164.1 Hint domain-containing protein [Poseidonocella pacifica]
MPLTWNAIYLGQYTTDIDLNENDDEYADNASVLVGQSYGSVDKPLSRNIVEVTSVNKNGQSYMLDADNDRHDDQLQFDLGDGRGTQTNIFDAASIYNATLTYEDGTVASITAVIMQDAEGNLFLAPEFEENDDMAAMEAKAIRSLSLDSLYSQTGEVMTVRTTTNFVCFATGTRIATREGDRAVETLTPGDMLMTADHGAQPLLWRGERHLDFKAGASPSERPVEIKAGALGDGIPARRLVVSPQHRLILQDKRREMLAPAIAFARARGIRRMEGRQTVRYHALLLARHEILYAEGARTESFYPGPWGIDRLAPIQRLEVISARPSLLSAAAGAYGPHAREVISRRNAEAIIRAGDWQKQARPKMSLSH